MNKFRRKMAMMIMCLSFFIMSGKDVLAAEPLHNEEIEVRQVSDNEDWSGTEGFSYVETIVLREGLVCEIYEKKPIFTTMSSTAYGETDFRLYYEGTNFGYLRQKTTWTYDGINRPTYVRGSNVFYSINDAGTLTTVEAYTANYSTSGKKYVNAAEVYYNSVYLATTEFTTICDKNGNCNYLATDR